MKEKHGYSGTGTYTSWQKLKARCDNKNDDRYADYGGRGITYNERWASFLAFLEDMGERPVGTSIDRIDNGGNYCKENCRWATAKEQQNNLRVTRKVMYKGRERTITELAEEYKIGRHTLETRIERGWNIEEAISRPLQKKSGLIEIDGQKKTLTEWCGVFRKDIKLVSIRICVLKWTPEEALRRPVRFCKRRQ